VSGEFLTAQLLKINFTTAQKCDKILIKCVFVFFTICSKKGGI
jgi:hypothetical protein